MGRQLGGPLENRTCQEFSPVLSLRREADALDLNQVRVPRRLPVLICVSHHLCLSLLNAVLPQILLFKMLTRVFALLRISLVFLPF